MVQVFPHCNPFLFTQPSLLATAVYSKNRSDPFWADPSSHWFLATLACPPLRATLVVTPETMGHYTFSHLVSLTCFFITLVTSYQQGGYAIIVIPIELGYRRKISEIPSFTRMSIVSVHHLSFLMAHMSNQLSQFRETHCLTSRYHELPRMHPVFRPPWSCRIHPRGDTFHSYHSSSSISSKKRA